MLHNTVEIAEAGNGKLLPCFERLHFGYAHISLPAYTARGYLSCRSSHCRWGQAGGPGDGSITQE